MSAEPNPILSLYDPASLRPTPSCLNCKHFDRRTFAFCAAFPKGIPYPIQRGDLAHHEALPGDHGIQYEPAEDAPLGLPPSFPYPDRTAFPVDPSMP